MHLLSIWLLLLIIVIHALLTLLPVSFASQTNVRSPSSSESPPIGLSAARRPLYKRQFLDWIFGRDWQGRQAQSSAARPVPEIGPELSSPQLLARAQELCAPEGWEPWGATCSYKISSVVRIHCKSSVPDRWGGTIKTVIARCPKDHYCTQLGPMDSNGFRPIVTVHRSQGTDDEVICESLRARLRRKRRQGQIAREAAVLDRQRLEYEREQQAHEAREAAEAMDPRLLSAEEQAVEYERQRELSRQHFAHRHPGEAAGRRFDPEVYRHRPLRHSADVVAIDDDQGVEQGLDGPPEWEPYEALPNEFDFLPPDDTGPSRRGQRHPRYPNPTRQPGEVQNLDDEQPPNDSDSDIAVSADVRHPCLHCCGIKSTAANSGASCSGAPSGRWSQIP